jgi:hypothetical protein
VSVCWIPKLQQYVPSLADPDWVLLKVELLMQAIHNRAQGRGDQTGPLRGYPVGSGRATWRISAQPVRVAVRAKR